MEIKSRIWIEKDGVPFLGYGRIKLLKMIDNKLSINSAAKELKMSYRKAWKLLNEMNLMTEKPIVIKNIGGKDGGGTVLTEYGKQLIQDFETINSNCMDYLEKEFEKLAL
ncbi:MAG: LysR family transcriptional regulator [Flavobacteriaceae bacterium]|nr:winged helix-turn-helix domain-containing protein [Bacteroidia bacterium]NNL15332.1 LysR family transcriptional regulator [Flavobacteriaceae bacterium]